MKIEPTEWKLSGIEDHHRETFNSLKICRVGQMEGEDKYAVRFLGRCLNKSDKWEFEPFPSSRTKAFLKRCRFDSLDEAVIRLSSAVDNGIVSVNGCTLRSDGTVYVGVEI